MPFLGQKCPYCPYKKSMVEIINITSICILDPFSVQNFKKIFRGDSELWGWDIFASICPKQEPFWEKLLISFSSTYWPLLLCKVLKDSYNRSRIMRMCHFWTQNEPICPNEVLFLRKTLFLTFMAICIPKTKFRYQSIYDILTIKKYWNLISWESFLVITWESCFSQTRSFFPEC